jgi:hypothetical protein
MASRLANLGAALIAWSFLICGNASAVTITSQSTSFLPPIPVNDSFPPSFTNPGTIYDHVAGSVANLYRSPYENPDNSMPAAYVGQTFSSVRSGSVGYNFKGGASDLSILWGSPDTYNTLSFYDGLNGGGTLLGSFTGSSLAAALGIGHDYVTFSSPVAFLSVVLGSGAPAFEYAALSVGGPGGLSPVPLPPALLLFGSGLLGLMFLRNRWNKVSQSV